jgi:molybdenum cofactor cytidylyltransferase
MAAIIPARGRSPQGTVPGSRRGQSPAGTVPRSVWIVILAAGGSRRFGRAKLLVRQGPITLLERSVRLGQAVAGPRCIVVLGARASRLAAALPFPTPVVVVNRRWREGMSTSLAAGLARLPRSARGALVLLADQYALTPQHLERLVARWRRNPGAIVAAQANGILGPPVLLPRSSFGAARRLRGDAGARSLLRSGHHAVRAVPLPLAAEDLDEPADLGRVQTEGRQRWRRNVPGTRA